LDLTFHDHPPATNVVTSIFEKATLVDCAFARLHPSTVKGLFFVQAFIIE
jgi:hypothetical protein